MSSSSVKESSYAMDKTELVTGMLVRAAWVEIGHRYPSEYTLMQSGRTAARTAAYTTSTYASSSVQESSYAMDKTELVTGILIPLYPCMARPLQPLNTPRRVSCIMRFLGLEVCVSTSLHVLRN